MRSTPNPEMLILARESRGLNQTQLASKIGDLSQSAISKFEGEIIEIPDERIREIAQTLEYPVRFFYQEGNRYGFGSPHLHHRRRQSIPLRQLRTIEAITNVRALEIARLLDGVEIETDAHFERLDVDEYDSPEQIAQIVRSKWRLPTGPVQDVIGAIESAGGVVLGSSFGTRKFDAISHWMPNGRPLFIFNEDAPGDRIRMTLAHETGHVIMHNVYSEDPEGEANRFAAEFLMPAREIKPQLRGLTFAKLGTLKYYWKVSMAALIRRAFDLGQISERQYRRFWTQMGKLGYRTMEPNPIPREEPSVVKVVVDVYRRHNGYSVAELSKLAALNEEEFRSLYLGEKPHLRLVK